MHAFLITGSTSDKRREHINTLVSDTWRVHRTDVHTINTNGESIGIAAVRRLSASLYLAPVLSNFCAAIIYDSHLLTVDAMQALLKTLEEPPAKSRIILESDHEHHFLPTILSRCQHIYLGTVPDVDTKIMEQCMNKELIPLLTMPMGKRLAMLDRIAISRQDAMKWTDRALATLAWYVRKNGPLDRKLMVKTAKKLLVARSQLEGNVHPKLCLDHVFLPEN